MNRHRSTRREYLTTLGGGTVAGFLPLGRIRHTDATQYDAVVADELVITESDVPPEFEQVTPPATSPLLGDLASMSQALADAETATTGFWAGNDESNPAWVVASFGVVADSPVSRRRIETAASESYTEYVQDYDAETSDSIEFDQSRQRDAETTDWRMEMIESPPASDLPVPSSVHLFTEVMQFQFHENVLIGTLVFGPVWADRDVDTTLARYARRQRTQLHAHADDS